MQLSDLTHRFVVFDRRIGRFFVVLAYIAFGLFGIALPARANIAEVVLVIGQGEKRLSEQANWLPAAPAHKVPAGGYVRTLANSQMGLLLPDRTQIRLNQNSLMQIKSAAEAVEWQQTTVKLHSGRAWSQARPAKRPGAEIADGTKLSMETPSATLSIRGTDWEVEILPDGATQLVVLSGVVEIDNAGGMLRVEPGERALAEPGKSPVKTRLIHPEHRVQWVSYWQAEPARWGGADHDADLRVAADTAMQRGEFAVALTLLTKRAELKDAQPLTVALYARILARNDRIEEARHMLQTALRSHPKDFELLLAQGDLALLNGDPQVARDAFDTVLLDVPKAVEAWHGLARIANEQGDLKVARVLLDHAGMADPIFRPVKVERAVTETLAGRYDIAEHLLSNVIADEPDNFTALAARGLNNLMRGQTEAALRSFLETETIEPGYARSHLFSSIAFYQLDDHRHTLQALEQARRLDQKDPLIDMLQGLVLSDEFDFGGAIAAARQAQEKLVYLKSLDQLANDQKGSANLGSALAKFGLEEWASHYAMLSATPFWAGSHLFLADRQLGRFNKNSALYLGFLTDPTVFGASNRNSSLFAVPGHHATVDLVAEKTTWKQSTLIGTLNGMVIEPFPLAYFLSGDLSAADSRENPSSAESRQYILGMGIRPRFDLSMFAFSTQARVEASLQTSGLRVEQLIQDETRTDLGMNYKMSPDHQFWIKLGNGRQGNSGSGAYTSVNIADSLNRRYATRIFLPDGRLSEYQTTVDHSELQFRLSAALPAGLFSIGAESAHADSPGRLDVEFAPAYLLFQRNATSRSKDWYLSLKREMEGKVTIQGDLWHQSNRIERHETATLKIPAIGENLSLKDERSRQDRVELNPRLGMVWQGGPLSSVRFAAQRWRRPASVASMGDLATLGIPLNDRLVTAGGLYRRVRLQFDLESSSTKFFHVFIDREMVDNGLNGLPSLVPSLESEQLEALRNRQVAFSPASDIEQPPEFERGQLNSLGIAGNLLLSARHALSLRYLYRDGRQAGLAGSLSIPYMPKTFLRLGSQWQLPGRVVFGLNATYRSERFRDRENLEPLAAGWSFGANAYWESADKRNGVHCIVDHLTSRDEASAEKRPTLSLRYTYKF